LAVLSLAGGGLLAVLLSPRVAPAQVAPEKPAAKPDAAGAQFFEKKIRPVLVEHCYGCHAASGKRVRGGLRLDTRAGLRKGGESGAAIVPGEARASLLIRALHHDGLAMPPKEKLPAEVIADFERWVEVGAPDPRDAGAAAGADEKAGRKLWSLQPLRRPPVPPVRDRNWPRTDVDRFLLAQLEGKGLHPVGDAERGTLLRRLTIDLTGLPPTPSEIDEFLADQSPQALARVVDRLLASPHFGERWGRHWLDVARYADSNGKDENLTFHEAWRYRDYVIAAFNRDKPFDAFLREQLAGDLLPAANQSRRDEQLIATGFLVVGPKMLFDRDKLKRKMDVIDEQIDTVGRAVLGLTVACARCHDHKFDPVPTADYYALAGIFGSTRTLDGIKEGNPLVAGWMMRPLGPYGARLDAARRAHEKKREDLAAALKEARTELLNLEGRPVTFGEWPRLAVARAHVQILEAEEKKLADAAPPSPPLAMAVCDEDSPADLPVNVRGNPHTPGPLVSRGFLRAASLGAAPAVPARQSGRLQLAQWLTAPDHPLTARVFVNRVWMHLFGEGLVRTVDNFGAQGEAPSHPELLDYLAARFVEDGWSVKRLVRSLVLSRAYQLAVAEDAAAARLDLENRWLWRANRRRVEAEVLRDAMLAVSGRLDRRPGGSAVTQLGEFAINNGSQGGLSTDGNVRRSVYLPVLRAYLPPLFEVFDFADPDACTGKRNVTTVPTQALYLMNSPFVLEQAEQAARRLLAECANDEARLDLLYRRALGRAPTSAELAAALKFLRGRGRDSRGSSRNEAECDAWTGVCLSVFGCTEFRYVD
jgi:cytochrome c553